MLPVLTVSTNGFSMDYITFGEGKRPLVILPGMSVTPVTPGGDGLRAAFASFEKTHTVFLFDRKHGFGQGYTVSDMAEDTAAAMCELGIRNADIFGASQGGMISQLLAARHHDLVHTMVLASSADCMDSRAAVVMQHWADLAHAGDPTVLNRDVSRHVYSDAYRETYRDAFRASETVGTKEDLDRFAVLAAACLAFDSRAELGKIACPVFVLGASDDITLFPERSVALAEQLRAPLYLYDGYSHAVYDEAPDFIDRVAKFLADHAA